MSIRNILVAFNGTDSSVTALKFAASLAVQPKTHVTAMCVHASQELADRHSVWVPQSAREIIQKATADLLDDIVASFESVRSELGLGDRLHFTQIQGRVDSVLSESARCYDLIVLGQEVVGTGDKSLALHPDRIALVSGCPVLIVPNDYSGPANFSKAALAWDGGRAAACALSDSMPLLENQADVAILTVGEAPLPRPVEELSIHLARHGVSSVHKPLATGEGVSETLLQYCADQPVGLLVMGAYEHSKFQEDFLGGVTAELLTKCPIPVLMSH